MVLGDPGRERERARSDGTARRRRGASSAVLGVRARGGATWRGRVGWGGQFGRTRWRGGGLAGRAARGVRPTASSRPAETGEGGESRESREKERERNLIDFKFEAFSKFSINTRKFLNMKDVPNFKSYHFCFRPTFIWDPIQKFNLNPDKCSYYPVRAKFKFFFNFCMKT